MTNIITFDSTRCRPGIRELMIKARGLVLTARSTGQWTGDGEVTPDHVLSCLPRPADLYGQSDAVIGDLARQACLLALAAIHAGAWSRPDRLAFFMDLQARAVALEDRIEAQSA